MNLYLISQDINNGYDRYDSAVVAAKNALDARRIHPSKYVTHIKDYKWMGTVRYGEHKGEKYEFGDTEWVGYKDIDKIKVEYLGETDRKRGVVLASFKAG